MKGGSIPIEQKKTSGMFSGYKVQEKSNQQNSCETSSNIQKGSISSLKANEMKQSGDTTKQYNQMNINSKQSDTSQGQPSNKMQMEHQRGELNTQTQTQAYFEETVASLLAYKLLPFKLWSKQVAYTQFVNSLSQKEKEQNKMMYLRCLEDITYPNQIEISQLELYLSNIIVNEGPYQYKAPATNEEKHWHVNFADQNLFHFYSSTLFAQDEIQVFEHPLLAHVLTLANQLAIKQPKFAPLTYQGQVPTPILVTGAFRLGEVNIKKDGFYKNGLYGNFFQTLKEEDLYKRLVVFDKDKTITNIIAMAAMGYQKGYYKNDQIKFILKTAYKAFFNAKQVDRNKKCIIHTGNWGCGAFGNDRILISIIQIMAAYLAKVDILIYHTMSPQGTSSLEKGKQFIQQLIENQKKNQFINSKDLIFKTEDFIKTIEQMGFKWGQSDGN